MDCRKNNGLAIAGCMFIGMGVGWAMGSLKAGLFIGLGIGLLFALVWNRNRNGGKG